MTHKIINKKYTIEQADYIEKYYPIKSDKELAEDLHIQIGKVKSIRYELGYKRQRQTVNKEAPEGMKWCWFCNEFHEKEMFSKNKNKPDGLQDECKKAVKHMVLKRKANKNKKPLKLKEKSCLECGEVKSISNFIKNVSTKDGYSNLCIECLNKNETARKFKNKEIK